MTREQAMEAMRAAGIHVVGRSEDFDGTPGAVWVSIESGVLSDFGWNWRAIERWYKSPECESLEAAGWWLECVDGGTGIFYPNPKE